MDFFIQKQLLLNSIHFLYDFLIPSTKMTAENKKIIYKKMIEIDKLILKVNELCTNTTKQSKS